MNLNERSNCEIPIILSGFYQSPIEKQPNTEIINIEHSPSNPLIEYATNTSFQEVDRSNCPQTAALPVCWT